MRVEQHGIRHGVPAVVLDRDLIVCHSRARLRAGAEAWCPGEVVAAVVGEIVLDIARQVGQAGVLDRGRRLSRGIEERHLHDLGSNFFPHGFNGEFHLQLGSQLGVGGFDAGQGNHLL
jgi:hypothetical protein